MKPRVGFGDQRFDEVLNATRRTADRAVQRETVLEGAVRGQERVFRGQASGPPVCNVQDHVGGSLCNGLLLYSQQAGSDLPPN